MRRIEQRALIATLLFAPGCGQPTAPLPAPPKAPATLCERQVMRRDELDGILQQPLVGNQAVPGDPDSCRYTTQGFPSITLSARSGAGRATLKAWRDGRVPLDSTPLPGVGDGALWQESLFELIAEQDDLLCEVQVSGTPADLALPSAALPARLAQLCRQIFARP